MAAFTSASREADPETKKLEDMEAEPLPLSSEDAVPVTVPLPIAIRVERSPVEFSLLFAEVEREMSGVDVRQSLAEQLDAEDTYTLGVTSAIPGEGKTTVALHLAMNAAYHTHRRVCLIDLGLCDDEIARRIGSTSSGVGIVSMLEGVGTTFPAIQIRGCDDLVIVPAGKKPTNAARAVRSPRISELFDAARRQFDVIIVDMPAISTNNALPLLPYLDGVLMVTRSGATPRGLVKRAIDHIDREKLLGVVLNRHRFAGPAWLGKWLNRGVSVTER